MFSAQSRLSGKHNARISLFRVASAQSTCPDVVIATMTDVNGVLNCVSMTSLKVLSGSLSTVSLPSLQYINGSLTIAALDGMSTAVDFPSLTHLRDVYLGGSACAGALDIRFSAPSVIINGSISLFSSETCTLSNLLIPGLTSVGSPLSEYALKFSISGEVGAIELAAKSTVSILGGMFILSDPGASFGRIVAENVARIGAVTAMLSCHPTRGQGAVVISGASWIVVPSLALSFTPNCEGDSGESENNNNGNNNNGDPPPPVMVVLANVSTVALLTSTSKVLPLLTVDGVFVPSVDDLMRCGGRGVYAHDDDTNRGCECFVPGTSCDTPPTTTTTTLVVTTTAAPTTRTAPAVARLHFAESFQALFRNATDEGDFAAATVAALVATGIPRGLILAVALVAASHGFDAVVTAASPAVAASVAAQAGQLVVQYHGAQYRATTSASQTPQSHKWLYFVIGGAAAGVVLIVVVVVMLHRRGVKRPQVCIFVSSVFLFSWYVSGCIYLFILYVVFTRRRSLMRRTKILQAGTRRRC